DGEPHVHLFLAIGEEPQWHPERVLDRVAGGVIDRIADHRAKLHEKLGIDVRRMLRIDTDLDPVRLPRLRLAPRELGGDADQIAPARDLESERPGSARGNLESFGRNYLQEQTPPTSPES